MGSSTLRAPRRLSATSKKDPVDYWTDFLFDEHFARGLRCFLQCPEVGRENHVGNRLLVPDYLAA